MTELERRNSFVWVLFGLLVAAGFSLFFVPAFIIRPFRYQSSQTLGLALIVRQYAPFWTVIAACAVLALAVLQWGHVRRLKKVLLVVGVLLTAVSAVMARMNYFEWMFHPVAQPGFEAASQSQLDAGEMVLTVTVGDEARAYPIREMAYHHIVNDVVGDEPLTVTY
jgi:Protein of unknown function (DUF3179)